MSEEMVVSVKAIEGFGSAKFGSDEPAVLKAITQDFKIVDGRGVRAYQHRKTGARVLTLHARGVVPGAPFSRVSYIFGDKSQKLVQVNVDWAPWIDPKSSDPVLMKVAGMLRQQFLKDGYTDLVPADKKSGPAFIARDENNRFIQLVLRRAAQKPAAAGEAKADAEETAKPLALTLSYVAPIRQPAAAPA